MYVIAIVELAGLLDHTGLQRTEDNSATSTRTLKQPIKPIPLTTREGERTLIGQSRTRNGLISQISSDVIAAA